MINLVAYIIFVSGLTGCTSPSNQEEIIQGKASYYADKFEGRPTASGELYRAAELTAAHRTLPFGTMVQVTNTRNKKSVIVRINDRGPHVQDRIIDVSRAAAEKLGFISQGITRVTIEVVKQP